MSSKRSYAKRKNTGPKITDQLTSTGRPITDTVSMSNTYNNSGRARGGGNRDRRPLPKLPPLTDFTSMAKKGFRAIPIIPTREELLAPEPGDIPKNIVDEAYDSIADYLETHYRLLREDCLKPLREGIQNLRSHVESTEPIPNLRVYERISLVGLTFANVGVVHRISFTPKPFERVHWSTSKRLLPGTLVVFTNDNFETMKFGTVFNRSLELLKKTYDLQIDILFQPEDIEFELSEGYIMVETTSSYFEAYRHVLNVLQELDPETLPFKEHIIDLNREIKRPEYLEKRFPTYEINAQPRTSHSLLKDEPDTPLKNVQGPKISPLMVDISREWGEWPKAEEIKLKLHSSQYEALKRMLTCRLALVQGPPGTGKTYVGLKAVKILLDNLPGPIVIACQTNHALDQFLEGIQAFEKDIIRLGSRSKSPKIIPCTLFNIRQEMKLTDFRPAKSTDIGRLFKDKDKTAKKMCELCEEIRNPFLKLDFIKEQGYLTEEQISSLKQDDWYVSSSSGDDNDDGERDYIQEWLEDSIATTNSKQNDRDFEMSQLILEDSGIQAEEDDDEFDEEDVEEIAADFQTNEIQLANDDQFGADYHFEKLRAEKYIRSDTHFRDNDIDKHLSAEDLWEIPIDYRVAIHNRWRRRRLKEVCDELKALWKKYSELSGKIKTERIREDLFLLKRSRIVGMTTTAAAKYHKLLMNLQPKIMIIEEAAETLEAHIVTALTPSVQHLVLIGDHQQLRPNVSVHELADSHFLNVSLFERLTKFLPYSQLTEQRRMRPPIRELLTPIYENRLTDHKDVIDYPDVPGFCENLYFLDHTEKETHVPETMSKINDFEAHMCAKLSSYLVRGGTSAKRITILSMYSGQRKQIIKYLKEDSRKTPDIRHIRVSSVDGFQGEENDIILLSLVRSRDARFGIGFLGVSNRVCVALSRARHGLYIFGNANQLSQQSGLWRDVIKILNNNQLCGQVLDLYCQRHSERDEDMFWTNITRVGDYIDVPLDGGCSRQCLAKMDCGHICPSTCHISSHDGITCQENCIRELPCGHTCSKPCEEICRCEEIIVARPTCGHYKEIPCYKKSEYRCTERCIKKLRCGHQCREECSSNFCSSTCLEKVNFNCPKCRHLNNITCSESRERRQDGCPFCT